MPSTDCAPIAGPGGPSGRPISLHSGFADGPLGSETGQSPSGLRRPKGRQLSGERVKMSKNLPCANCGSADHGWADCKATTICGLKFCQCARSMACWVEAENNEMVRALLAQDAVVIRKRSTGAKINVAQVRQRGQARRGDLFRRTWLRIPAGALRRPGRVQGTRRRYIWAHDPL